MHTCAWKKGCYVTCHPCNTYSSWKDSSDLQGHPLGLGWGRAVQRVEDAGFSTLSAVPVMRHLDVKYLRGPKYAHPHGWARLYATASFKRHLGNWANCSRLTLGYLDTGQFAEICCFKSPCWKSSKRFCKATKTVWPSAVTGNSDKEEGAQSHHLLSMSLSVLHTLSHCYPHIRTEKTAFKGQVACPSLFSSQGAELGGKLGFCEAKPHALSTPPLGLLKGP